MAPAKLASLKAIFRQTTRFTGCPRRALDQLESAAEATARAMGISPDFVRAFVVDMHRNLNARLS